MAKERERENMRVVSLKPKQDSFKKDRTVDNAKYTYTYHYLNKLMVGYIHVCIMLWDSITQYYLQRCQFSSNQLIQRFNVRLYITE